MEGIVTNTDKAMTRLRWSVVLLTAAGAFASFGALTELYLQGTAISVGVGLAASVLAFVGVYSVFFSRIVFAG